MERLGTFFTESDSFHAYVVPTEETDYVPGGISQQFSMSNQGQQLCLSVTIINDNTPEANETFCMRLTSRHPAVILDPANAIVTIYDDDDSEGQFCSFIQTIVRCKMPR